MESEPVRDYSGHAAAAANGNNRPTGTGEEGTNRNQFPYVVRYGNAEECAECISLPHNRHHLQ